MNPFFSIIIPTYNRAGLLPVAIESVINQSFKEWELIIVDDGSKDNTRQVVAGYTDSRIKYIYQDNAERSAARNNGIKNALGTYICFLDSDDYYLPDRLELLYQYISANNFTENFYYTGICYNINGVISRRAELKNTHSNIFDFILLAAIGTPQVCIHQKILKNNKFNPKYHIGEDMELWLRIVAQTHPVYIDEQFTVMAVEHSERSVNIKRYNSFIHQLNMLKSVFSENHPGSNVSKTIKHNILSNCYFGAAKYYIYSGSRANAIMNLVKSIVINPSNNQTLYRTNILIKLLLPNGIKNATNLLE